MMHYNRRWGLEGAHVDASNEAALKKLAEEITGRTWTLCTAWALINAPDDNSAQSVQKYYILANDATSEDGAGEYAVFLVQGESIRQIESITFSWCDARIALQYIKEITLGKHDSVDHKHGIPKLSQFENPHGGDVWCELCA